MIVDELFPIYGAKQKIARATGIPMTKQGLERKIGSTLLKGAKKLIK